MYLCDVVKAIGIEDEASVVNLQHHWKRVRQYNNLVLPLSYLMAFVILFGVMLILTGSLLAVYGDLPDLFDAPSAILILVFLFWVLIQVSRRIVDSILNRYYGDTLAVV